MLEGKSLAVGVGVGVVVVEGEEVVVDNRWERTMADKLALEEEEAALRVLDSSLGHRLGRILACMVEDREVGVGVAQVVGEVWRDRARSGGVVPSALGLEDERKVEDTSVELFRKEKIKYMVSFNSKLKAIKCLDLSLLNKV